MTRIIFVLLLLCPMLVWADNTHNLGLAANNLNSLVAFIYGILDIILYVGAAILGMSGLLKYRLHRQNPQQVPLSTPVTEIALAGVLLLLAFLVQLSTSHKTVSNPNLPNIVTQGRSAPPADNTYPY